MVTTITDNIVTLGVRKHHQTHSAYILPNDAVEHDLLNAQAAAITEMIGGAPMRAPLRATSLRKAVDVGCGTGIATIQLASRFPSSKVYGLDISPIPMRAKLLAPSNVKWVLGNILDADHHAEHEKTEDNLIQSEVFLPGSIDYIFGRMLFLGVSNWARYFSIAAQSLRPGGIIEHQDLDWKFYGAQTDECISDNWEWHKHIMRHNEKSGLSNYAGSNAKLFLEAAGFKIISCQSYEFSFVPTAKTPDSLHMGRYVQEKLMPHYPELLRKMLGDQGLPEYVFQDLTADCLRDLSSEPGVHQKYTVTVAMKL